MPQKERKNKLTLLRYRGPSNDERSQESDESYQEQRIGFAFKKRREPVNWRVFSGIQVDRVFRQVYSNFAFI